MSSFTVQVSATKPAIVLLRNHITFIPGSLFMLGFHAPALFPTYQDTSIPFAFLFLLTEGITSTFLLLSTAKRTAPLSGRHWGPSTHSSRPGQMHSSHSTHRASVLKLLTQTWRCSSPLQKAAYCLHITYGHPPIYCKSSLDEIPDTVGCYINSCYPLLSQE